MGQHQVQSDLERAEMKSSGRIFNTPAGYLMGWGTTVGNGVEGWAPGAMFVHTDGGSADGLSVNEGTVTTASWVIPQP